jgi:hypothetical protein
MQQKSAKTHFDSISVLAALQRGSVSYSFDRNSFAKSFLRLEKTCVGCVGAVVKSTGSFAVDSQNLVCGTSYSCLSLWC